MPILNNDRVTIGLYGFQEGETFSKSFLGEIKNIKLIRANLCYAALMADRASPEIVISLFLIPEWDKESSFENNHYLRAQKQMLDIFIDRLHKERLSDNKVKNFNDESKLHEDEKGYLIKLTSKGSCADMIKMHALIDEDNENRRHLQLDSNTKIHDYVGLYNTTFGDTKVSSIISTM